MYTSTSLLYSAIIALAALLPQTAMATHYKLFVLTGQSNSLGTTNGGETDPTSGSDPSDQHVLFAWDNFDTSSVSFNSSGGVFTTLQDQPGGEYGGSATHWGPEMEFARTLYRAGARNFGVIKASRGGGGNGNWLKPAAMYNNVVSTVNTATATLTTNGDTFEIVGLLYLQGESDSSAEAAIAGTRLKILTDNLRADLTNASSMHTICAGITYAGSAQDDTTRANQAAIAVSTSYIDYFENTDLQDRLAPDGIHLNKAAKIVVGNRFGQTFLNTSIVDRQYGNLVFIGDSITQGGNGRPSYRYQVFTNLANAGVPINATTGYKFSGSISGAYQSNAGSTPNVNGQAFENNHDGHWGWRAMWVNERVALPAGQRSSNRGEGTILNWTGDASPQEYVTDGGTVDFPDLTTSGTGVTNPYTAYTPDTASIMIGINESTVSSATQLRDDLGTMIDQLRTSNPNIRIHLNQLLYSDNVTFSVVDTVNALLPQLVADKNAASTTSPVWLVTANDGFVPSTHTYDNTHPNTTGEIQVGNIISGSLGIIGFPGSTTPVTTLSLEEKSSDALDCLQFQGSAIYNTGSFASGWSATGDITATPVGLNDIRLHHPGGAGDVLVGTNTGWSDINDGVWTFTTRLKFDANANGFILWLGTGTHRIQIEIHGDRTQDFGGTAFNVAHNNLDGNYHTFKVTHDPTAAVYHVWRDGVLLTAAAGAPYDQTGADERLLMGDYTGGTFGNGFDVTVDYINFCQGYEGHEIYNGTSNINGWAAVGGVSQTQVTPSDLQITNTTGGGSWLEGTNAGWSDNNDGVWTFEIRLKFDALPNGFRFWLGTGTHLMLIELYADRTQDDGAGSFNVSHNNADGNYHTFRVGHDPDAGVYHAWRDGVRLSPLAGTGYDSTSNEERLILGDTTGGTFGNGFDATIDYIRWDTGNAYLPVGADADSDGMSDLWENTHFGDLINGVATDDEDNDGQSNLDEYNADTHPFDESSRLRVESIAETTTDNWSISVPDTSPNRNYTLFESDDLGISDTWTAVSGQGPVTGNNGSLVFTDTSSAQKFYRVEVTIP